MVQLDSLRMAISNISLTCWITKATSTHSEYVIRIVLLHQNYLRERASVLSYNYTACLVCAIILELKTNILLDSSYGVRS
jgi:hypothetical protein